MARKGNTLNLLAHLWTTHGKLRADVKAAIKGKQESSPKECGISQSANAGRNRTNSQKYERNRKQWKEITDAVTHYIAKDTLPIYSVEKPALSDCWARNDIPSRSLFKDGITQPLCLYPRSSETRDWSSKALFCNYWHVVQCWYEAVYELHFILLMMGGS